MTFTQREEGGVCLLLLNTEWQNIVAVYEECPCKDIGQNHAYEAKSTQEIDGFLLFDVTFGGWSGDGPVFIDFEPLTVGMKGGAEGAVLGRIYQ